VTAARLAEEDRAVLRLAGEHWNNAAAKEQAIRDRFGISPVRFYQRLAALMSSPAAEAAEPVIVHRLQRVVAARRARRWGRGEELERTDPAVAAAAVSYDRMVERITSKPLPEPREDISVPAAAPPAVPPPPPADFLAVGLDHPSRRVRKLAAAAQRAVDELVTALLAADR